MYKDIIYLNFKSACVRIQGDTMVKYFFFPLFLIIPPKIPLRNI